MFDFLALITNKKYWLFHSWVIKIILKLYGIRIGKNFYIEGIPKLKINGKGSNIIIKDNVQIWGNIDIRNRENGAIIIYDNVRLDENCRLIAANDGTLSIGKNSKIGIGSILCAGMNVEIGEDCIFANHVFMCTSDHKHSRAQKIIEQGYIHAPITIKDDVWLGENVNISMGVTLGEGAIVGGSGFVSKDLEPYSINVGIPTKKIGSRV